MNADSFIARWQGAGGTERQNSQSFLLELCDLLDVPRPGPEHRDDYAFEREVKHTERGLTTSRFIDLYCRGAFILESKQSFDRRRGGADPRQGDFLGSVLVKDEPTGTPAWQRLMGRAFNQARGYVADLPPDHPAPPFLILVDVGRVIELYADFTGQGRNYTQFPDRKSFQIPIEALREPQVRDRLRAVWIDPKSLDPALHAAAVTKDVAERLARVAAALERRYDPAKVSGFLMRCLFTMFAEDAGLLPKDGFRNLLADLRDRPGDLSHELEALWDSMDRGAYAPALKHRLRRFNGGLFADHTALPLDADATAELAIAAGKDWREVEPAIFGTFLERALNPRERASLGAHYTPRAYVERLVVATVIDPLREDWETVQARMAELVDAGDIQGALAAARAFHHTLCTTRVLDPACGTGNFLYVALELMKRLEGEVLEYVERLGGQAGLQLASETVDPSQFLGLELNPRAAAIAEVVLWVGYLKWQLRTGGLQAIPEPVLRAHGNIRQQDALLAFAGREPLIDAAGMPVTVWDGHTMKPHPVTGLPVPDGEARVPSFRYRNPRRADWPEAEFVVGNPPFIGGKDMRAELGDGYAEALWKARPEVPGGADLVMHFWDEAGRQLADPRSPLRRFGFITTNSMTQAFSRRVVERHLGGKRPVSLAFAVADHPWVKGGGRAAVRIAMTVMRRGQREGVLGTVAAEEGLNTDAPQVRLEKRRGTITAKLTLGADVTVAAPLLANEGLAHMGVKLHGGGFLVTPQEARALGLGTVPELENHILPYLNGRDVAQTPRGMMVIDLYGLTADNVRSRFPHVYARVVDYVKPERDLNRRSAYKDRWWIWGEPRPEWRSAIIGQPAFIGTTRTAKHRIFRRIEPPTVIESKVVGIACGRPEVLAILQSRTHCFFAENTGGWLGVGNDPTYNHSDCFNPFPFPALLTDYTPDAHGSALLDRLRELGERLERLRDDRLAADRKLTLTGLYNRLERRREALHGGPPLTEEEREDHARHHVPLLMELHDDIDRAALSAWGWGDLTDALVGRPGATLPSDLKAPEQEEAEDVLLSRLVALNRERRAEEARGQVRWLRPAYQVPKLKGRVPEGEQADLQVEAPAGLPEPRPWPKAPLAQLAETRALLSEADGPLSADALARSFTGRVTAKRRERVEEVLAALSDLGLVRHEGGTGYLARR